MVCKVRRNLYCSSLLVAILHACNAPLPSTSLPGQEAAQRPTPQATVAPKEVNPLSLGPDGGMPRGDEAWRQFTADGRYRIARASDFSFSDAALQSGGHDLDMRLVSPYMVGDIDRDYRSRDVGVIVIDTTRDEAERFGLVIFTELKGGDREAIPQPFWLYRERDLSKAMLSWDSEGMNLRTYRDDGSFTLCRIKWNKRQQRYYCK